MERPDFGAAWAMAVAGAGVVALSDLFAFSRASRHSFNSLICLLAASRRSERISFSV